MNTPKDSLIELISQRNFNEIRTRIRDCSHSEQNEILKFVVYTDDLEMLKFLFAVCNVVKDVNLLPYARNLVMLQYLVYDCGELVPKNFFNNRYYNTVDIVKFLVENGADPTINGGITLQVAVITNNFDLVKYLISVGVDPKCGILQFVGCIDPVSKEMYALLEEYGAVCL